VPTSLGITCPVNPTSLISDWLCTLEKFNTACNAFAQQLKSKGRVVSLKVMEHLATFSNPHAPSYISPVIIKKFYELEICDGWSPLPTICHFIVELNPDHIPTTYIKNHSTKKAQYLMEWVETMAEFVQHATTHLTLHLHPLSIFPSHPVAADGAAPRVNPALYHLPSYLLPSNTFHRCFPLFSTICEPVMMVTPLFICTSTGIHTVLVVQDTML
jgi:hypothetical protein